MGHQAPCSLACPGLEKTLRQGAAPPTVLLAGAGACVLRGPRWGTDSFITPSDCPDATVHPRRAPSAGGKPGAPMCRCVTDRATQAPRSFSVSNPLPAKKNPLPAGEGESRKQEVPLPRTLHPRTCMWIAGGAGWSLLPCLLAEGLSNGRDIRQEKGGSRGWSRGPSVTPAPPLPPCKEGGRRRCPGPHSAQGPRASSQTGRAAC